MHSISLFADDIIMVMTEVDSSFAALGIDTSTSNRLRMQYPYTWTTEGIKYLGITLAANVDLLR